MLHDVRGCLDDGRSEGHPIHVRHEGGIVPQGVQLVVDGLDSFLVGRPMEAPAGDDLSHRRMQLLRWGTQ
ncbi:hypothetical protein D3C73_1584220 [compost metagenome]